MLIVLPKLTKFREKVWRPGPPETKVGGLGPCGPPGSATYGWSAHYASVKALHVGIDGVVDPLNALCDSNEDLDTHGDAHGIFILDAMQSFAFFLS